MSDKFRRMKTRDDRRNTNIRENSEMSQVVENIGTKMIRLPNYVELSEEETGN